MVQGACAPMRGLEGEPRLSMPGEAQAKGNMLLLLSRSLLHAHRIASHRDRAPIVAALSRLVTLLHSVTLVVSSPEDSVLAELDDEDDQARVLADEGHLRLAAAAALLRVAGRLADMLPVAAYVSLAMMLLDPVSQVRLIVGRRYAGDHVPITCRSAAHIAPILSLAGMRLREKRHICCASRSPLGLSPSQRSNVNGTDMVSHAQVRAAFGVKLREALLEAAREADKPATTAWLSRYVSMMAIANADPERRHCEAMAAALVQCFAAWRERVATGGGAAATDEVASTQSTELAAQPEYSVFSLMFLVAQLPDCPDPHELQAAHGAGNGSDDEVRLRHGWPSSRLRCAASRAMHAQSKLTVETCHVVLVASVNSGAERASEVLCYDAGGCRRS